jgi:arginyl-tRNA synthetase
MFNKLKFKPMKTREEKINAIVENVKENIENYEEIQNIYEYSCEQYPENKEDEDYLEQTIRDYLGIKEDEEINEMYKSLYDAVPCETKELKLKLEEYTLEEIENAYREFNPEFFNGHYNIPTTIDGWVEQIIEDIDGNGYSFEDIF